MKAHLMFRDGDFDVKQELPPNEEALRQDLELDIMFSAMAQGDDFLLSVAKPAVLSAITNDLETICYRQAVLKDCLRNFPVVESIYAIAVEAIDVKRRQWLGIYSHSPGSVLYGALELMNMFMGVLKKLRAVADEHAGGFESEGFKALFAQLKTELTDEYFALVQAHLKELRLASGILVSAELGDGNEGRNYVLRNSPGPQPNWFQQLFAPAPPGFTFRIADRDEAGAQALSELQDRGLNFVANALAQSADHILSYFVMLRTELAFYVGCVNLHRQLGRKGAPRCFPVPIQCGARRHSCAGLCDVSLALKLGQRPVGNTLDADGKNLVVVTGANQGGKSTFLRSIGVAQLMMQAGMFVAAEVFSADLCRSLFTHYKREEDITMTSGKFDEELSRMKGIVDALTPDAMLLFNESFAATNDREGSEVAAQIVHALLESRVKVFFVTHLYLFPHDLCERHTKSALFLRAERQADGRRTFKVAPGEPLQTSFGIDLYEEIFRDAAPRPDRRSSAANPTPIETQLSL